MENARPSPVITVIIPTYNWSSVLPYSIGSVLRQTRTDWELWVVGDGCTDDSSHVVSQFKDPRIHWHNLEKNIGQQGGPINEGLKRSRGKYIAYLGHDDVWLPHHLELLSAALEAGADLAYGWISLVGADGKKRLSPPQAYQASDWLPPTSFMHRRSVLEKVGPWKLPAELTMDPEADLLKRMHESGALFKEICRITAIKFPACERQGVYRERPCHEQARAAERIAQNADLEKEELLSLLADMRQPPRISLKILLKHRWQLFHKKHLGYRDEYQKRRQFKGLPPK